MIRKVSKVAKAPVFNVRQLSGLGKDCVVNSHNEFDLLEEVIVGRVEGATIPEWHVSGKAVWPTKWWDMYKTKGGQPFPEELAKNGKLFNIELVRSMNKLLYCSCD